MKRSDAGEGQSASELISRRIVELGAWRGNVLDRMRNLIKEADPELERLLAEEEEIERSVREHHETPHFRPGDGE